MKKLAVLIFLVSLSPALLAQRTHFDEGNAFFERRLYKEAIGEYNLALKERIVINKDVMLARIADTYHMLFEYQNAEDAYRKVFAESSSITPENHLNMARVLINNQKYDEALKYVESYSKAGGNAAMADLLKKQCEWAKRNANLMQDITVTQTNIETGSRSIGVAFHPNGLLVANPQTQDFVNNTAYYDLAYAKASNPTTFTIEGSLEGEMHHDYYEGSPSLTADGKTIYYTGNSSEITRYRERKLEKNKYAISKEGVNILKIYAAREKDGKWMDVQEVSVSSNEYDCTFPQISGDGRTLYFVSNMPGGYGGYDIYRSTMNADSTWNKPENLGPNINTPFDELYPYVFENMLYFSSKGHEGYGGSDIYTAIIDGNGFQKAQNIGQPLNTAKDDFGLIIRRDAGKRTGYFSSNRVGPNGYDYIFHFEDKLPSVQRFKIIESPVDVIKITVADVRPDISWDANNPISSDSTFTQVRRTDAPPVYLMELEELEPKLAMKVCIAVLGDDGTIIGYAEYVEGSRFKADFTQLKPECREAEVVDTVTEVVIEQVAVNPVNYKKMHGYNLTSITDQEADFNAFIKGAANIANATGKVTIVIESSASQVPTTKFATNEKLTRARADELKKKIQAGLKKAGVADNKVVFADVKTLVQGPPYADDRENTAKYSPYQYVQATAK